MSSDFKKVAIIGLGLIGGSLAIDIKRKNLAEQVIGITRKKEVLKKAELEGVIDRGTTELEQGVSEADLVFICTPVFSIIETFKKIVSVLKPETLVTDVGSTKSLIIQEVSKFCPPSIHFIGGHPMAGSEKSGFESARSDLFKGAVYILTPLARTPIDIVDKFSSFLEKIGARVTTLTPEEHDRIVALVSHLPYLTAVALVNSILSIPSYQEFLKFAAGGFRDTTRVAGSLPEVWVDICTSNREEIIKALSILEKEIGEIKKALTKNNVLKLSRILKSSYELRKELFN